MGFEKFQGVQGRSSIFQWQGSQKDSGGCPGVFKRVFKGFHETYKTDVS